MEAIRHVGILFQVRESGWSRDTAGGAVELLPNQRKGSVLSRSASAAKFGTKLHLRQPKPSGLSRRHQQRAKRNALFHRSPDRVSVCVTGKSIITRRPAQTIA